MHVEELEIDEEESEILASATLRVTELYDIPLPSETILAWVGLANALGKVYGPRVGAYAMRKARKPPITLVAKQPATATPSPSPSAPAAGPSFNPSMFDPA